MSGTNKYTPQVIFQFVTRQPKALLVSVVALVSVFLLATGLSGLELLPGEPDAFGFVFRSIQLRDPEIRLNENVLNLIRIFYLIGLILFPFWLVYIIINPQARKQFLRDLMTFGLFLVMILMLTSYFSERLQQKADQEGQFQGASGNQFGEASGSDFGTGPSEEMMWLASILVALAVVGFLSVVVWLIWRSRRQKEAALEQIASEVQSALDELQAGGDLRNVVIRCYSEMMQALRQLRGIHRNGSLTPREFEETLRSLGFSMEPIHQLTHLFEDVRYGRKPVTRREELIATDSLMAILDACRSKG